MQETTTTKKRPIKFSCEFFAIIFFATVFMFLFFTFLPIGLKICWQNFCSFVVVAIQSHSTCCCDDSIQLVAVEFSIFLFCLSFVFEFLSRFFYYYYFTHRQSQQSIKLCYCCTFHSIFASVKAVSSSRTKVKRKDVNNNSNSKKSTKIHRIWLTRHIVRYTTLIQTCINCT